MSKPVPTEKLTPMTHRLKIMPGRHLYVGRLCLLALLLAVYPACSCGQDLLIPSGAIVTCTGGDIILDGDLVNNGSLINQNNTIIFTGTSQSVSGTSPIEFRNLTVGPASSTTLASPGQAIREILRCEGTLNAGGNLTLLSSASGTALIDGSGTGQVTGNVTIQRYLPYAFGYKYFSSPFQGSTVSEFGDDMDLLSAFPSFYRFDESLATSGWISYTAPAGILNPMEGYAVNFGSVLQPGTVDLSGVVNNGPIEKTLYNHNNPYTSGFCLVGNPYPSPVDWDSPGGWTRDNIDDAIYYFSASTTDEYGGSYSTYINGSSSDGIANGIIPSSQAFFVHVSGGAYPVTGRFGMDNSVRVTDQTQPFIKSSPKGVRSMLRLAAGYTDDSVSFDPLVIYFDDKATFNFDGQFDALKLFNTDTSVPNFYSFSDDQSKLSVNGIPDNGHQPDKIRLGISTKRDAEIVFRIKAIEGDLFGSSIVLIDSVNGTRQNLFPDKLYQVSLNAGDYDNRFYIGFAEISTGVPATAQDPDLLTIYSGAGVLKTRINTLTLNRGTVKVCSLTGQVLYEARVYEPGYHEFRPGIKSGIYIMSLTTDSGNISRKFYFRGDR